jgi:hypothetical protein
MSPPLAKSVMEPARRPAAAARPPLTPTPRPAPPVLPAMSNAAVVAAARAAPGPSRPPLPSGASNAAVAASVRAGTPARSDAVSSAPASPSAALAPRDTPSGAAAPPPPTPPSGAAAEGSAAVAAPLAAAGPGAAAKTDAARQTSKPAATAERPAPTGKATRVEGAEPKDRRTASARAEAAAGSPSDALAELAALPPSGMAHGLNAARHSGATGFSQMHAQLARTPPSLDRPSGLPRKSVPIEAPAPAPALVKAPPPEPPVPGAQPTPTPTPEPTAPLPASDVDSGALDRIPESELDELPEWAQQILGRVPTTDESVDTSAGERPTVKLDKDADPAEMGREEAAKRTTADGAWVGARAGMQEYEGEDDIYPTVPKEKLRAHVPGGKPPAAGRPLGPSALDQPEVAAAVDVAARGKWADQIAKAQQDNAAAVEQKTADERTKRDETAAAIAQAEKDAIEEQTGQQLQAKETVGAARAAWNEELAGADKTYTTKVKTARDEHQSQIDKAEKEGNDQARSTLDQAEVDAETERKKKVTEAEAKKREGEKESGGFLGWLKSKAKALINKIRAAVNAIFDALRKAVKFIIDKAKKLAVWVIEQARRAIVGLIHAFGKLLELAADVFLAAFPEARKKAKAWIRRGVKAAEDAVNAAAEKLKKGVCRLLDALGAALDFILAVYQKAFNLILDVVEFFVVGLIEIIEGIVRLAQSASKVGDFFLGQVEEEGLGVDLIQPLPIEKPKAGQDMNTATQSAVESGAISPTDAAVLTRGSLNDSDAVVEPVAKLQLEPALIATVLPQVASGDYHFGENDAPQSQRGEIQKDVLAAHTGGEPSAAVSSLPGTAPAAGKSPAQMTPEEQLDYLEAQETPHTCNEKKSEEPAKEEAVPAHMRIYGPFTASQRFRYMWGQIKKGISQWWSCNWGKVIAAFAVGALVALLLGILTGGAIFAAIPPLLEIVGTLMVGVAVARGASYIGDYLSLAWKGNVVGGAKALARGFAILLIELVFALLFNIGAVIKALKSGLKGTVKAVTGAVKGALKTTAKAVGELGHAVLNVGKATLKNSKLIIQGFRQGFGGGIRTIGQLTRDLFSKLHFRGFFFRLKGRMLQLWGRFNPTVLCGEQELTIEQAERAFKAIAESGEKLVPTTRTEAENLAKAVTKVVGEGGEFSKTLRERVRRFFNKVKLQNVSENPVLTEAWTRALRRLENGQYGKYFKGGKLIDNVPADAMKEMYKAARGNVDLALEEVLGELEKGFGQQLANRVTKLPENVQMHHLVYKSIEPEFALTHSNLVLALRKTGGSPDELHDLFHLISAAGTGNRWHKLHEEIKDIIKDLYEL